MLIVCGFRTVFSFKVIIQRRCERLHSVDNAIIGQCVAAGGKENGRGNRSIELC
jgi:hypothetical protein